MKYLNFKSLLFFFVLLPFVSLGQEEWYKPDASDLLGVDRSKYKTIGSIHDYFENPYLAINSEPKHGLVVYKPLVNMPVAILAKNKAEAQLCLAEYKKTQYSSSIFDYDFRNLTKATLDTADIIKYVGAPVTINEDDDNYVQYHYAGFYLTFIKGTSFSKTYLEDYTRVDATKARLLGLGIAGIAINLSDSDDDYVTGIRFSVFNFSKKKIKYVYATVSAINPVGDLVSKKVATGVGPILAGESASYSFDNLFFSRVAERVKISVLKVLYFDGTSKTLTQQQITQATIDK
ncbi:hypothetical protein [Pedobacter sp. Leaf132]|uniref:hypothetical protein n=1 Tax=Pedobacter sp. Leaf132 TaxID=2876557 RepID=UPI001E5F15E9|nr:hypothetical protein [Pedobacter sp. Leaf132]